VDFAIVGKFAQTLIPDGATVSHSKPASNPDSKVVIGDALLGATYYFLWLRPKTQLDVFAVEEHSARDFAIVGKLLKRFPGLGCPI
jgi:hypothetical protein